MKRKALALTLVLSLLLAAAAGAFFVGLGKANPFGQAVDRGQMQSPSTTTLHVAFPLNNTILKTDSISVILNVSIVKSISQTQTTQYQKYIDSISEVYYSSDWQQNGTSIFEEHSYSITKFNYQLNLTEIPEGKHNVTFYAIEAGSYYASILEYYSFSTKVSSAIAFTVDTASPNVTLLSLRNKTYYEHDVSLDFSVDEPAQNITYSLDGADNSTVVGNATLSGLPVGEHNVTVYAWDAAGNVGASETMKFTVAEPFPMGPVVASSVVIAAVAAGLLVYMRSRRRALHN